MRNKPIYPDIRLNGRAIEVEGRPNELEWHYMAETYLRKKHKGKWYLIHHFNRACTRNSEEAKSIVLRELAENIYFSILFHKIDPNLKHPTFGNLMYPLDDFQGSELERFKHLHQR